MSTYACLKQLGIQLLWVPIVAVDGNQDAKPHKQYIKKTSAFRPHTYPDVHYY